MKYNPSFNSVNETKLIETQSKILQSLGLSLKVTEDKLVKLYAENPEFNNKFQSMHHNLIVGFSNYRYKQILEIGTHSGVGSALLAISYPNARITTIDLQDTSEVFSSKRFGIPGNDQPDKRKLFIDRRNKLLNKYKNINFIQTNSTFLLDFPENYYDLILIDGDHTSPQVILDTLNAIRCVKVGGLLIFDDLIIENDAYEIVSHFVKLNIIDLVLIDKLLPNTKEHKKIGVSKKQFLTSFFN